MSGLPQREATRAAAAVAQGPSRPEGTAHDGEHRDENAHERKRRQAEVTVVPVTLGEDYDIHTSVRSGCFYPLCIGRQRSKSSARASQLGPRLSHPYSRLQMPLETLLRKHLRFAGNPAVMALRLRPVALRPRLSTGLPFSNTENMPNKSRPHKRNIPKLTRRSPHPRVPAPSAAFRAPGHTRHIL